MLMKINKNIFLYLIITFFSLTLSLVADEFDITASNIKLFQDNEKILAEGNVLIVGSDGIIIEAESATYDKKKKIICLAGDGSIMMNLQELETIN